MIMLSQTILFLVLFLLHYSIVAKAKEIKWHYKWFAYFELLVIKTVYNENSNDKNNICNAFHMKYKAIVVFGLNSVI